MCSSDLIAESLGLVNGNNGPDTEKIQWGSITVTTADTQQGDLVLVNKTHVYTFPADESHLSEIWAKWNAHEPRIYQQSGLSTYMETDALNALDTMLKDFYVATGKNDVQIRYAYRTYEEEGALFQPGYSDYHTGRGVQLRYYRNSNTSPSPPRRRITGSTRTATSTASWFATLPTRSRRPTWRTTQITSASWAWLTPPT